MGDLVGAFPKTWRELVVVLVRLEAGVRGSRLVLLKEFLRYTAVEVSYSGTSTVQTHSGLPEGGMLGPLCYPLLPMMLDRCSAAAGAGISADAGSATQADLSGFNALDPGSTTALGQIDAAARLRLRILLIADDQIMPASNIFSLQASADLAGEWATNTPSSTMWTGRPEKTAVLSLGQAALKDIYDQSPVTLAGRPVPCTLLRKWCGIVWDAWLSFIPFMDSCFAAARAAFKPFCALARSGAAPLAEIRAVMQAKVEGAFLFGSMFLFMAPGYYEALVSLQLEFERSLLGLASWVVPEVVRAVGGWQLVWGERVMADVLAFRAELWCCSADMLVSRVWSEAQHFKGKTFATASQSLVIYFSVGEVHDHPFWGHGAEAKRKALLAYKISVKNALVARSTARWKSSLQARAGTGIHILAQQYPVSVGHILLDHDRLDLLWDAMSFDSLRLQTLRTSGEDISGQSCCLLCGGLDHGLAHLLTEVYLYTGR